MPWSTILHRRVVLATCVLAAAWSTATAQPTRTCVSPDYFGSTFPAVLERGMAGTFKPDAAAEVPYQRRQMLLRSGVPDGVIDVAGSFEFDSLMCAPRADTSLVVRNIGFSALEIDSLRVAGADASAFMITSPSLPVVIAPGDSVLVGIRFAPSIARTYGALLRIRNDATNAIDSTTTVQLAARLDSAGFEFPDTAVAFGEVAPGEFSLDSFTVVNTGTVDLGWTTPVPYGAFVLERFVPAVIPSGETGVAVVRFTADLPGARHDTVLRLAHEECGVSAMVRLSGSVAYPDLVPAAGSYDFGTTVCSNVVDTNVIVVNAGGYMLNFGGVSIEGADAAGFQMLDTLAAGTTLAPGDTLRLAVRFAPGSAGDKAATLVFESDGFNAIGGRTEVALRGRRDSIGFRMERTSFLIGGLLPYEAATDTVTITNTGERRLEFNLPADLGRFSIDAPVPATLDPGASAVITIRFDGAPPDTTVEATYVLLENVCRSSAGLSLVATTEKAFARLHIDTLSGLPGDTVEVAIYLRDARNVPVGTKFIEATLRYDLSLLEPIGMPSTIESAHRLVPLVMPLPVGDDSVLVRLKFRAMLGSVPATALMLEDLRSDERIELSATDGGFALHAICLAGGERLFLDAPIVLGRSHPNPARDQTAFSFEIAEPGHTRITLQDITGRRVATLVDANLDPGAYDVVVDTSTLPAGRYFYVLRTPTTMLHRSLEVAR